ncbi:hypothetical protein ECSTECDG1313_5438 [Escherichia coli STEC_DG131-3]|nr:hypothetical protein ECSTECDG1313_5438 [Escherichia coli STEC_DG131-3]
MAIFVPSPSVTTAMPSSAEKAGMDTAAYKKLILIFHWKVLFS